MHTSDNTQNSAARNLTRHHGSDSLVFGQLAQLQKLFAFLASASNRAGIGDIFVKELMPSINAVRGAIAVLEPDKKALGTVNAGGTILKSQTLWYSRAIDFPIPRADTSSGIPAIVSTSGELKKYPVLNAMLGDVQHENFIALPMFAGSTLLGCLAFCFEKDWELNQSERLALHCHAICIGHGSNS